ncbi:hypothetical protein NE237_023780 [Protea cynaroides]|uniref:RBR-type E3 ubiquitin transferase n=1 Tax=Protea cynaroides TaxID=273540 RepID=A0A9Q0K5H8_9MAGN|nr:hypothetical protein NE237_023780 [Protea cynaroides]
MGNIQGKQISRGSSKALNQKEEEESSFTCEICIEPIPGNKKFKNKKRCAHSFCTDCIAKYIEAKMEGEAAMKCPGLHCERQLDPISCRAILSQRQFESWSDVLCQAAVLKWERAYCPYPECSTLILNECGESVKKSNCPNCKKLFCYQCKIPWHAGFGCDKTVEMRERNDVLFAELAQRRKWIRCPSCNHCVELASGCPVVRCRCGISFCYGCGRKTPNQLCWCKKTVGHSFCLVIVLLAILILVLGVFVGIFMGIRALIRR